MRAFVALPLPDPLSGEMERLSEMVDFGRPVAAENLHLTLAFLDDQPREALAALHDELSALAPRVAVDGLDVFGGAKPRVLFASVAADARLADLQKAVRRAARAAGIVLPHERYRPHITLARISPRDRNSATPLARFLTRFGPTQVAPVTAPTFGLYASYLRADGPVYEPLALYPLAP